MITRRQRHLIRPPLEGLRRPYCGDRSATRRLLVGLLLIAFTVPAEGGERHSAPTKSYPRSAEIEREFERQHPCPPTGQTSGPCPGYVKDHIRPLACGGPDAVSNLQWQTTEGAKAKDRVERRGCSRFKKPLPETSGSVTILRGRGSQR